MQKLDSSKFVHVTNQRYRQHYHIMTPGGWLNDPNGLCYFKGYYHVFYQFHPYSSQWGPMHWGHVRSHDLVHWEQLPIALIPGDPEDSGGCFSGSAIIKGDRLYLIYTGHHYYGDGNPDHFWENQNLAYSDDGIHFTKYQHNPIIEAPADNTQHFRDPKVWEHDGAYYLVLGSQHQGDKLGRILLYRSSDLLNWKPCGPIIQSQGKSTEGWMWECPDFFSLNGQDVLVYSPMGIQPQGKRFLNLSQVCYRIGHLDYRTHHFIGTPQQELDHGHNFYATQSMLTPNGRRIQFGWMSPFNEKIPEQADGWAGSLTLPRELTLVNNILHVRPARELTALRNHTDINGDINVNGQQDLTVTDSQHTELIFNFQKTPHDFTWLLRAGQEILIKLTYQDNQLTLMRQGKDPYRYTTVKGLQDLHIFIDTSSLEIFANDGAAVFTERYYANEPVKLAVAATENCKSVVQAYQLK